MNTDENFNRSAIQDQRLVNDARTGDAKAFTQLMARNKSLVYFKLLRIIRDKAVAEELTIESFGKAFINIHQYEPRYPFSSWLLRIAQNAAIDHLRRRKSANTNLKIPWQSDLFAEPEFGVMIRSSIDNPEEAFIKEENAVLLRKVIAAIEPRYRILLEMRYLKDYTYSEIASELHLPVGTIKVQLHRSRKLLSKLVTNNHISWS